MAKDYGLYQRGPKKIWHYDFEVDGVRYAKSTRTAALGIARERARVVHEAATKKAQGIQDPPLFKDLVAEWLEAHPWEGAPGEDGVVSQKHHRGVETNARLHLAGFAGARIDKITTAAVEALRNRLMKTMKRRSVNAVLRTLSLLLGWARKKRKYLREAPCAIELLSISEEDKPTVPLELVLRYLEACEEGSGEAVALGLEIVFSMGLREIETRRLRREWFRRDQQALALQRTKNKKVRVLPVPDHLWARILPMLEAQPEGLLLTHVDGSALAEGYARRAMARANKATGLKLSIHRIRGTFATNLMKLGADLRDAGDMLGHADPETTMIYVETDLKAKRKAVERLAKLTGLAKRKKGAKAPRAAGS